MPESDSESNVNLDLILDFEVPVSVRFGKYSNAVKMLCSSA